MAIILNLIPDIEDQIINLLHIGDIIQLSVVNQAANQKIINYLPYKSAKQFYNTVQLSDYNSEYTGYKYYTYWKYCFAACRKGDLEIIRYLFQKYYLNTNILKIAYEEILKTNNINIIQEFSRQFAKYNLKSLLSHNIQWYLSLDIIKQIDNINIIPISIAAWEKAHYFRNYDLMAYIYKNTNIPLDRVYFMYAGHENSIDQLKWLVNNCKIDSRINNYFNGTIYSFIWPYYNSKYNGEIYSNPADQFLIILGKIILEDNNINLLEDIIPFKNQLDQAIIYHCIQTIEWWEQKLDLGQYLIQNFITDNNYIINLLTCQPKLELVDNLLEKLDNYSILFQEPAIYDLLADLVLTSKLISRKLIPISICTEGNFTTAASHNNHLILKYILEKKNKKLDLPKIKNILKYIKITGSETIIILFEAGLFDCENIKRIYIPDIYQEYIYGTDLLALIIREIKKSDYKFEFDINKLFKFACSASKKQAKLIYDNYKQFIHLNKNQMVWLGIN